LLGTAILALVTGAVAYKSHEIVATALEREYNKTQQVDTNSREGVNRDLIDRADDFLTILKGLGPSSKMARRIIAITAVTNLLLCVWAWFKATSHVLSPADASFLLLTLVLFPILLLISILTALVWSF
jgi:CBS domain containing-hemolysin-like protein